MTAISRLLPPITAISLGAQHPQLSLPFSSSSSCLAPSPYMQIPVSRSITIMQGRGTVHPLLRATADIYKRGGKGFKKAFNLQKLDFALEKKINISRR